MEKRSTKDHSKPVVFLKMLPWEILPACRIASTQICLTKRFPPHAWPKRKIVSRAVRWAFSLWREMLEVDIRSHDRGRSCVRQARQVLAEASHLLSLFEKGKPWK